MHMNTSQQTKQELPIEIDSMTIIIESFKNLLIKHGYSEKEAELTQKAINHKVNALYAQHLQSLIPSYQINALSENFSNDTVAKFVRNFTSSQDNSKKVLETISTFYEESFIPFFSTLLPKAFPGKSKQELEKIRQDFFNELGLS